MSSENLDAVLALQLTMRHRSRHLESVTLSDIIYKDNASTQLLWELRDKRSPRPLSKSLALRRHLTHLMPLLASPPLLVENPVTPA